MAPICVPILEPGYGWRLLEIVSGGQKLYRSPVLRLVSSALIASGGSLS